MWKFLFIQPLIQVLRETNLEARDMDFDHFYHAVSNSGYTGIDFTLMVLSRMLKVIIAIVHPDYIWLSHVDVNIREATVVLVYNGQRVFHTTGTN